jgi:hypothetical protein
VAKFSARQSALLDRAIDFGGLHASAAMVPWNRAATPLIADNHQVVGVVHAKELHGIDDPALATSP